MSDDAMARSLCSVLSFLSFTGLGMERQPADISTICHFRNLLAERGLAEEVFGEIVSQLAVHGMVLKKGSIVESTIAETAKPPRPGMRRGTKDHLDAPLCDPEAGPGRRGRLGYKAHISMDAGIQVVRRVKVERANRSGFAPNQSERPGH